MNKMYNKNIILNFIICDIFKISIEILFKINKSSDEVIMNPMIKDSVY